MALMTAAAFVPCPRLCVKDRSILILSTSNRCRYPSSNSPCRNRRAQVKARLAQGPQRIGGRGYFIEQNALRHLELDPPRIAAGFAHDGDDPLGEVRGPELHRRQIHRDEEIGPALRGLTGLAQIHSPSGTISPVCSATGMNWLGGMNPRTGCRQRISASTPIARRCDLRLVGHFEAVIGIERDAKLLLDDPAHIDGLVHLRRKVRKQFRPSALAR